ncbi:MAG: complex I NDUFA9 subunit family protein [Alphaproteobacteria bacterium]|uniref:complex I NDUFA9 subunit family protein n=1 Tax=Maricaulis alexandrii TaxID=2570354 RepID=UPI001108DE44|nr:complex I NDUFA9 subunit family protein [Maricaulis alexandrii]MCR9266070.1 complex I NDUFA9 subunit family protein [Alphaproteobacteria bacterium]
MLRDDIITVFGGSGFIGRHIVRALAKAGYRVRVASRRPHLAQDLRVMGVVGQVQLVQANLRVAASVERALEGASGVVNLVGILNESGRQTFSRLHALGAKTVAEAAASARISRVIQMSAIGADADSASQYARSKAEGEAAVKAAVPTATILRPSIVFGTDDAFFNRFADMARFAPALPLFGGGKTKFQPVFAGDVAEAVVAALETPEAQGETYELGGPGVYTFAELMRFILDEIDRPRFLLPLPWQIGSVIAMMSELAAILPFVQPMLTRDQLIQLKSDNVVAEGAKTLADLGVQAETVDSIVPNYLVRYRRYGQFHEREV